MSLYARLLARYYDRAMRKVEQLCLGQWRRKLLAQSAGQILEIGAGTGANLPHFPPAGTFFLCEPDRFMRKQLLKKLPPRLQGQVSDWSAEKIELPGMSIDTVVCTLVLCSVADPQQALKEICRVLRPGGQLLFIEHIGSEQSRVRFWQRLLEPLWRNACGNCHLTRNTVATIEAAGLKVEEMTEDELPGAPAIVRRTVRGRARKPHSGNETSLSNLDLSPAPSCPHCSSGDVARIIYGKPALTRQIIEGLESGKIISGGCMLHGGAPQWHCNSCRQDFGKQILESVEPG